MAIVNDAFRDYQILGGKQSLETFTTLYYVYGIDAVYARPDGKTVQAVEDLIKRYNIANPSKTLPRPVAPTKIPPVENPGGGGSTTQPNTGDTGGTSSDQPPSTPCPDGYEWVRCSDSDYIGYNPTTSEKGTDCTAMTPGSNQGVLATTTKNTACVEKGSPYADPRNIPCDLPSKPGWKCQKKATNDSEQKCCDGLVKATESIAAVLQKIADGLNKQYNNVCDNIDGCTDKIISAIDRKYAGIQKTCKQCEDELRNGLAGTLEYAITCANKTCDKVTRECSNAHPEYEGQECKGCGKEPCCCKDGSCEPCDKQEPKADDYIGWCNRVSGVIIVTKNDEPAPGVNFERVASGPDSNAVSFAAYSACQSVPTIPVGNIPIEPKFPIFGAQSCKIDSYLTKSGVDGWLGTTGGSTMLGTLLGIIDASEQTLTTGIAGLTPAGQLMKGVFSLVKNPLTIAQSSAPAFAAMMGCDVKQWEEMYKALVTVGYIESKVGTSFDQFKLPFVYSMNSLCRNKQTNASNALLGYLADCITRDTLEKHWSIEGYCPDAVNLAVESSRSKPVPMQLAMQRRRELISPSEYKHGMRQLGYMDGDSNDHIYKLTESLPTLTDILRFMVRDADDADLVNRFGLATGFEDKYRSQLKQWSQFQGIPDKVAEYAWYSHWTIPSPGQLFEFWHRLRYNKDFGGKDKLLGDIKAALIQQDILPYWHEHYLAVSFHPLTRVDARRGFELGSMTKQQLKDSFIDQGYSDENADILVTYSERRRIITAQGHKAIKLWHKLAIDREEAYRRMTKDGLPGEVANAALDDAQVGFESGPLAASFVKGLITREEFIRILNDYDVSGPWAAKIATALSFKITNNQAIEDYNHGTESAANAVSRAVADGMAREVAERLVKEIDGKIDGQLAANCQRSVKRRFLLGEFNDDNATAKLLAFDIDKDRATKLVKGWHCELSSIGKAIPAAKLCGWLERGVIQAAEFVDRLVRIGYSKHDAELMVQDCLIDIDKKRAKAADKAAKEQQQQQDKAERLQKQNAAAAIRAANANEKRTAAANKARTMRAKIETSAAEKVVKRCGVELFDALSMIRTEKTRIMSENPISLDDALQVLVLAAEGYDCLEHSTYSEAVDAILLTFISEYVKSNGE